jgi:hypothetical protein
MAVSAQVLSGFYNQDISKVDQLLNDPESLVRHVAHVLEHEDLGYNIAHEILVYVADRGQLEAVTEAIHRQLGIEREIIALYLPLHDPRAEPVEYAFDLLRILCTDLAVWRQSLAIVGQMAALSQEQLPLVEGWAQLDQDEFLRAMERAMASGGGLRRIIDSARDVRAGMIANDLNNLVRPWEQDLALAQEGDMDQQRRIGNIADNLRELVSLAQFAHCLDAIITDADIALLPPDERQTVQQIRETLAAASAEAQILLFLAVQTTGDQQDDYRGIIHRLTGWDAGAVRVFISDYQLVLERLGSLRRQAAQAAAEQAVS